MSDLLKGELVRLTAETGDDAAAWAKWETDAQFKRLLDSDPPRLHTVAQTRKELERERKPDDRGFGFAIRALADDKLLGFTALWVTSWIHRDAFLAIGLGDREHWGKGYGTDALQVTLRYAFTELMMHRVSLNVFANNARAIRSYEKAGFKYEGRLREGMLRDGQRINIIYMGILREEFESKA